jgi:hypothetical protein
MVTVSRSPKLAAELARTRKPLAPLTAVPRTGHTTRDVLAAVRELTGEASPAAQIAALKDIAERAEESDDLAAELVHERRASAKHDEDDGDEDDDDDEGDTEASRGLMPGLPDKRKPKGKSKRPKLAADPLLPGLSGDPLAKPRTMVQR